MAKASLETAVWDLYAKRKNEPLATILGGTKDHIDVGVSIGIKDTIEALIKEIKENIDAGYKRIKIKIKPGKDVNVLRKVREEFPNIPIMADANSAYTLEDRSEEHTSELQSRGHLVCRLLLEKKNT